MDILIHIKGEHEEFKKLMNKITESKTKDKNKLFKELYAKIYGHHYAEENILFPVVKGIVNEENKEIVKEMIEEHNLAIYQFNIVEITSVEDETWNAKFEVLKELIELHMREEEKDLIPLARKVLSKEQVENLFDEFESLHEYKMKEKLKELK